MFLIQVTLENGVESRKSIKTVNSTPYNKNFSVYSPELTSTEKSEILLFPELNGKKKCLLAIVEIYRLNLSDWRLTQTYEIQR